MCHHGLEDKLRTGEGKTRTHQRIIVNYFPWEKFFLGLS